MVDCLDVGLVLDLRECLAEPVADYSALTGQFSLLFWIKMTPLGIDRAGVSILEAQGALHVFCAVSSPSSVQACSLWACFRLRPACVDTWSTQPGHPRPLALLALCQGCPCLSCLPFSSLPQVSERWHGCGSPEVRFPKSTY